ncbi:hypothetical protein MRX96_040435 [Rhipicephalus microplus]
MPAHGLWSLFLFSSSVLMAVAGSNKFMRSKDIYLNLTTLKWPYIKCIRAKPTLKNKTAQTLSQDIFIKMAIGGNTTWCSFKLGAMGKQSVQHQL